MPVHDWTRVIAGIFHDFHHSWIGTIRDSLNDGRMPPEYYALAEQVAAGPHPDLLALEVTPAATDEFSPSGGNGRRGGAIALLEHPPQVQYTETVEREIYAHSANRVAIYHASGDRVVAFVKIVSPGNKHSVYELDKFLEKLTETLDRGIHVLVVDVHPPGKHDPRGLHAAYWGLRSEQAKGVSAEQPLGMSAYRCDIAPTAYFQPVAVGEPLPDMPVFLTPDHYVNVPLEQAYNDAWRGVPARWQRVIEAREN